MQARAHGSPSLPNPTMARPLLEPEENRDTDVVATLRKLIIINALCFLQLITKGHSTAFL